MRCHQFVLLLAILGCGSAKDAADTSGSVSPSSDTDTDTDTDVTVYPATGETVEPFGFDPQLQKPKAYALGFAEFGGGEGYIEARWICGTDTPCDEQEPGTGYYNLTADRVQSDLSTPAAIALMAAGPNLGEPGVPYFAWREFDSAATYEVAANTTYLPQWVSDGGPYVGLQLNVPTGYPGGMPAADAIPLVDLRYVTFEMRATACLPPYAAEPWSSGRLVYYVSSFNGTMDRPNGSNGLDMAINLQRFTRTPTGMWTHGGIATPGRARWECDAMNLFVHPVCGTTTVDIDGPSWGITQAADFDFQASDECHLTYDSAQPFVSVVIDVPRVLTRLVDEGFVTEEWIDGASYVGGIIGGVEFFGPAAVRSQFRRHTLHRTTTSTPAASLIEATRTWLDANEPDFLPTGSPDLAYRTTVDVTGACADGVEAHDPCSGVDEFGDVCDSGDTLLLCNKGRDGSGAAWFPIGSSQACTTQIADDLCTEAGETCLNGIDVLTCTEADGGPDSIPMWSPETSVYGARPLDENDFANGLHPWATP